MKLALVLMFAQGELPFLRLHIPTSCDMFDGLVAITDPCCTDGSLDYMRSIGADVLVEPWTHNWGAFATRLFNYAEELGYDAAMRLDPDEVIMPDAGNEIKRLLTEEATLLVFPRHEFYYDRLHVRPDLYPDHQARAWRLNRGIIVQGLRHEGVSFEKHQISEHSQDPNTRVLRIRGTGPHIYHYQSASRTGIWRTMLKYVAHDHISAGLPPPQALQPGTPMVEREVIDFVEPQPLDPYRIGLTAPFIE